MGAERHEGELIRTVEGDWGQGCSHVHTAVCRILHSCKLWKSSNEFSPSLEISQWL